MQLTSEHKKWLLWGVVGLVCLVLVIILWTAVGELVAAIVGAIMAAFGSNRLGRYTEAERRSHEEKALAQAEATAAERAAIEEALAAKARAKLEQREANKKAKDAINKAQTQAQVDAITDASLDEHEAFLDEVAPDSREQQGFVRGDFLLHALCISLVLLLASMAWGTPTPPSSSLDHAKVRAQRTTKLLNRYRRALKDARTRHREEVMRIQARATQREKELRAELKACNQQKIILSKTKSCLPEAMGGVAGGFGGGAAVCLMVVGGLLWSGKLKAQP